MRRFGIEEGGDILSAKENIFIERCKLRSRLVGRNWQSSGGGREQSWERKSILRSWTK